MTAHPIHPAVVHFPLGLLLSASAADLLHLAGIWSNPPFSALLIAAGLLGGLGAMAAGLYDFARLDETIVPHALRHMGTVGLAWLGYAVALYLRRETLTGSSEPSGASIAVCLASALILAFGGWLGGELVYRYGAGRIAK
ncbi:MAG TPA: DUF2231 domain-containing protein [Croceibacterium sp.]|nr:DUF2231 domain-containing protein [Croceibacterium sp.]